MNLVTAVIVEQAVDQGNREREVKLAFERSRRKRVMRELEELFATIDTNHDGQLELLEILSSDLGVLERLGDLFGINDISDTSKWALFCQDIQYLFQDLDVDQSGCVQKDEFIQGLMRVSESTTLADRHILVRLEKLCMS